MNKADVVGIAIYTGLAGTVLVLAGVLVFSIFTRLSFGA